MASELYNTIDALSREKGIDPQIVVSAVEDAIVVATRKYYKTQENLRAELDKDSGKISAYAVKSVVESPEQVAKAIVPLCLIILGLAFFPQFGLSKSESSLQVSMFAASQPGGNAPFQAISAQSAELNGWWSYPPLSAVRYSPATAPRPRRVYTYGKTSTHRNVHS